MWPFRKTAAPAWASVSAPAPEPLPPEPEYAHYRVLRRDDGQLWELGFGAMGLTYKAEDTNLRVPVALKVISPLIVEQPGAREFFLAEARGAASLRHRNTASVHHLGVSRTGEFFFAMEFIEGETVDTLIKRQHRLGVPLALDIAQQTACALAAAGHRKIVHRDIKPANLMLTNEDDGTLLVKVIDFGLCKAIGIDGPEIGKKKAEPRFLGTPHYASPEQIRCDAGIDSRSDFYSLGATLWTMLAGRPVFNGSLSLIRQRHLEEPPPFGELPSEVSPPVRTLLADLLQKDPAARPRTPLELIDRIEGAAYDHRGAASDPRKHWKNNGCIPLVGSVLAHNYHLEAVVEEVGADGSPVFRAEDVAGGRTVAVTLLDRDRPLEPIRQLTERVAGAPHPNLIENLAFSSCRGQPFIVNEWLNGFSLAEALGARGGAFSLTDAHALIDQATRAIDHAHTHGLGLLELGTNSIQVHFTGGPLTPAQRRELPSAPVSAWPAFLLKFRVRAGVAVEGAAAFDREAIGGLGHLAAELLGSGGSSTLDAPLSEIEAGAVSLPDTPDAVCELIGRAVRPDSGFSSGSEFAAALAAASNSR